MNKSLIPKIIFIYLLGVELAYMFFGYSIDEIRVSKFTLFELGYFPAMAYVAVGMWKFFDQKTRDKTDTVILVIIIYCLYQAFVVMPLNIYVLGNSFNETYGLLKTRSYFLFIPFILWYIFPSFKHIHIPIKWMEIATVILLILTVLKYLQGNYEITSTGQLRIAAGVAAVFFAFVLVTNLSFFSGSKNNPFLIAVAMVGLVFANHRSAYLSIGLLIIISLLNSNRLVNKKKKTLLYSLLIIVIVLLPLSQISLISKNFLGRVTTSFNYKEENAQTRMVDWELAWNYYLEHPINGSLSDKKFYDDVYENHPPPHNFIFQVITTQGTVGLVFISTMLYLLLVMGFKNRRDPVSFQMFLALTFYVAFCLINTNFFENWNILVLAFSAAAILYRDSSMAAMRQYLYLILSAEEEKHKQVFPAAESFLLKD